MQDIFQQRLDLLGLEAGVEARLAPISGSLTRHLETALHRFDARMGQAPSAARFLYGRERIEAGNIGPAAHWQALVAGRFDTAFIAAAMRTGQRHARLGVDPRWHVGSYAVILGDLVRGTVRDSVSAAIGARRGPLALLGVHDGNRIVEVTDAMAEGLATLVGAALLGLDLGLAGYVEKLREDHQAALGLSAQRLHQSVARAGAALALAAEGKRDDRLMIGVDPDLAPLLEGAEALADRVGGLVRNLDEASRAVETLAVQVCRGAQAMSESRAAQAQQGRAVVAALAEAVPGVEGMAADLSRLAGWTRTLARRCGRGRSQLGKARAALAQAGSAAAGRPAPDEKAEELAFAANLLAARLHSEAGDDGIIGDMRALGQGLAQLAAQLRASEARRAQVQSAVDDDLMGLQAMFDQLAADLARDFKPLAEAARNGQQGVEGLRDAGKLARALQAGLAADTQQAAVVEAELRQAAQSAAALAGLAAAFDPVQEEPDMPRGQQGFPAPDNAALAAHWHVL